MLTLFDHTSQMSHLNLPNVLSGSRLLMAAAMVWLVSESLWVVAAIVIDVDRDAVARPERTGKATNENPSLRSF